ncbi:hypothetical protein DYB30_005659 [Aphanomyces astaci]|uniref:Uncharacterized protein n=2 Tax=Aphanomyces astaci TaxID=112090 RepID=A0A397CU85_APHAT|nr:hypothetical protein DYB30_005659 [Aphanomyces astaci]
MDYFTLAKALVGELVPGGDSVTFTGYLYSMGGALAQLMAIESNSKAVVFASNGVLDVLSQYHVNPAVVANLPTSHLVNIMHPQDDVPKLDCQIGTLFLHNDVSHDHLHESFVYGDLAWNQLVHTPYSSHVEHGRVWSQSHGICIDNDLNDPMAFAVDSVAQSSSSQALATLVGGGLVLVAIKMLARWRK